MSRENNALTQGTVRASSGDNASMVAGSGEWAQKYVKPIIMKRRRQWAGEVKPAQAGPEEMAQGSGLFAWRQTAINRKMEFGGNFFYSAFSLCWRIVSMLEWNMNSSSLHILPPPTHPMRKISRAMCSLSCFLYFWEMRVNYLIHSEITTDCWVPFVHSTALDQNPGMIASWTMRILVKGQTGKY